MGDAIVVRRRRCKAFGASFGPDVNDRVDGDRGIVVDPERSPSADCRTETADEATGRRCAIRGRDVAKLTIGDAVDGMITDRRPKEPGRRAANAAVGAEHKDLCGALVYDRERAPLVIP